MPNVFISPCGTSLLTNKIDDNLRNLLFKTANYQEAELSQEEHTQIAHHIQQRHEIMLGLIDLKSVKEFSAELNGILTYYHNQIPQSGIPDYHYILVSDTYQGRQVGDIIVAWLRQQGLQAEAVNIRDLATNERDRFRLAMSELVNWCETIVKPYRESQYHVIFNLTGGFKSVQGFLQAMGMFYADESIYIFQYSSELLSIPRLPIRLDADEYIEQNLTTFRRLAGKFPVNKTDCQGIPETLLFFLENDDTVELSEWGNLIWSQLKSSYYEKKLLPPLSDKLLYSQQFQKDCQSLDFQKMREVNIRCDQISCYLDSNKEAHLKSLDFKQLKGRKYGDSTHECDAWADGKAKRLYGHFIGDGKYLIDRLDHALH